MTAIDWIAVRLTLVLPNQEHESGLMNLDTGAPVTDWARIRTKGDSVDWDSATRWHMVAAAHKARARARTQMDQVNALRKRLSDRGDVVGLRHLRREARGHAAYMTSLVEQIEGNLEAAEWAQAAAELAEAQS